MQFRSSQPACASSTHFNISKWPRLAALTAVRFGIEDNYFSKPTSTTRSDLPKPQPHRLSGLTTKETFCSPQYLKLVGRCGSENDGILTSGVSPKRKGLVMEKKAVRALFPADLPKDIAQVVTPQTTWPTDFPFPAGFFLRKDETKDSEFYAQPRINIHHIDDPAIAALTNYYASVVQSYNTGNTSSPPLHSQSE